MEQRENLCACGCGARVPLARNGLPTRYLRGHHRRTAPPGTACAVESCAADASVRGWCQRHYTRWKKWGDPEVDSLSPEFRFARATVEGPVPDYAPELGPCLLFTGATNTSGYGQFRYNGRNGYAHRYAWERVYDPIPKHLEIDHLCRVRTCVRLEHLDLVDGPENTRRAVRAVKECKRGHELTPENTVRGTIARCVTCQTAQIKRAGARRTNAARGLPDRRINYDQDVVRAQIVEIRAARSTIAQAARVIGCHANYLGRRVWTETKADVFKRDEGCVRCGASGPLDAQHRKARGRGGTTNPETSFGMANLIALCRPCHDHVETHRKWAQSLGYAVPQWQDPAVMPVRHWQLGWAWPTPDGAWIPALSGWDNDGQPHWITPTYAKDLAISRGIPVDPMDPRFVRLCTDLTDAVLGIRGVTA